MLTALQVRAPLHCKSLPEKLFSHCLRGLGVWWLLPAKTSMTILCVYVCVCVCVCEQIGTF